MQSMIRVASISQKICVANPKVSAQNIISAIKKMEDVAPDIILFPQNALTGAQCGDLLKSSTLQSAILDSINFIAISLKESNCIILIGASILEKSIPTNVTFVIYHGEIIAKIDKSQNDVIFCINGVNFNIFTDTPKSFAESVCILSRVGADITFFPTAINSTALSVMQTARDFNTLSGITSSAIVVSNCGIGDTSFPKIAKGFAGIFECNKTQSFRQSLKHQCDCVFDVDVDIIRAQKVANEQEIFSGEPAFTFNIPQKNSPSLIRTLSQTPYLPLQKQERLAYLDDLFMLACASLSRRMESIGIKKLVIGISGGLDSTLALLICAKAMQMQHLPLANITAVTMKGLGTSTKTYDNSKILMQGLEVTSKDIPIATAVCQHFCDIEHDINLHDVAFENAQARERTQILFDIANMNNALVVGTGDLSEASLGFCTFGGDHLSSFNVNICINKTTIRLLVARLLDTEFEKISFVLQDILDTPISPELLPPDNDGEISQKTETILGEYELHDFFLYYFLKYNFSRDKILTYAVSSFANKYDKDYISQKLDIFYKRFLTSQFKRSCKPDSASITQVNLNNFVIPSDLSYEIAKYL